MVVEAIAREVRRRRSHSAHQRIVAHSADVEAKTGIWAIAEQFSLATPHDAAIVAVAELESDQFCTADQSLLNTLTPCRGYVQKLEA